MKQDVCCKPGWVEWLNSLGVLGQRNSLGAKWDTKEQEPQVLSETHEERHKIG